jgi:hypothetical protein
VNFENALKIATNGLLLNAKSGIAVPYKIKTRGGM